jgi:putative membrane protein
MMNMMDGMGGMGGMMLWMTIWGVVGLALLVGLGVVLVRLVRRGDGAREVPRGDSPEEILRRRYAAGELDEDEYFRRSSGLRE